MNNLDLKNSDLETIAKIYQLHPHFQPQSYISTRIEKLDNERLRFSILDCPALHQDEDLFWFVGEDSEDAHPGIAAIATHVNPHARLQPCASAEGAVRSWEITIDESNTPVKESFEMQIARASRGVNFKFERRRLPGLIAKG